MDWTDRLVAVWVDPPTAGLALDAAPSWFRAAAVVARERPAVRRGTLPPERFRLLLDAAFADPPDHPDGLTLLLVAAIECAFLTDDAPAVEVLMARLGQLTPGLVRVEAIAALHRIDLQVAALSGDTPRGIRAAMAGLDAMPEGSVLRMEFLCKWVLMRINDLDLNGLDAAVERLDASADLVQRAGHHLQDIRNAYALACGRPEVVLAHPAQPDGGGVSVVHRIHAHLLNGDHDAAVRAIGLLTRSAPAAGVHGKVSRMIAATLRIQAEYESRHYAEAGARLVQVLDATPAGRFGHDDLTRLAIRLELAQRRPDRARALLARLDPERLRGDLLIDRVRLAVLEDDEAGAAVFFARLLAKGPPSMVAAQVRAAHELDAGRLARIWALASTPGQPPTRPVPAAPASSHPQPWRFVGDGESARQVRQLIADYAHLDPPVLIEGETGTGKEVVARLLHQAGPRATGPFLALNCAGLPDALAEAELFGHSKGAFTGAITDQPGLLRAAAGGTLLLDEINSMSVRLQGLLLRVLDQGEYRPIGNPRTQLATCRFIIAANQSLAEAVQAGTFRADLLHRLGRLTITLPPLRSRREDLQVLCDHLLASLSGRDDLAIAPDLMRAFRAHDWPGNVRELRNRIERMVLLRGERKVFTLADCPTLGRTERAAGTALLDVPGSPRARDRRRRILALFSQHSRLYPQDVRRVHDCSPTTITADLRALVAARLIDQVITSGNHKTTYYVRRH